jgi:ComF family protein
LWGTLRHWLLDLMLPVECLNCGAEGEWICPDCRRLLKITRPETCVICAKAADKGICDRCRRIHSLDGVISLFAYDQEAVQRLVKGVKFGGALDAYRFFVDTYGRLLGERLPRELELVAVPIPISTRRYRERGFNQASVLAEALVHRLHLDTWDGLVRVRDTKAQALLNKHERKSNIRRAFAVRGVVPEHVLLIDDVITSGATLGEAARLLKKRGAQKVWALTIAHG